MNDDFGSMWEDMVTAQVQITVPRWVQLLRRFRTCSVS